MIAIPVAAFMGPVAISVGPAPQTRCNDFGPGPPMIAIPDADDCGSLHLAGDRGRQGSTPAIRAHPCARRSICQNAARATGSRDAGGRRGKAAPYRRARSAGDHATGLRILGRRSSPIANRQPDRSDAIGVAPRTAACTRSHAYRRRRSQGSEPDRAGKARKLQRLLTRRRAREPRCQSSPAHGLPLEVSFPSSFRSAKERGCARRANRQREARAYRPLPPERQSYCELPKIAEAYV